MSDSKLLAVLNNSMEASLVAGKLQSEGIAAHVNGSKDYVAHLMGGDVGRFKVFVSSEDLQHARQILTSINVKAASDEAGLTIGASGKLKRALAFAALASMILPIVFNVLSLKNWVEYLRLEPSVTKKFFWSLVILSLQILTIALIWMFAQHYINS